MEEFRAEFLAMARAAKQDSVSGSENDASDTSGQTRMLTETAYLAAGRKLGSCGGGTFYEVASQNEEMWLAIDEEAFWAPQNACCPVKSSVEAKRTRYEQMTEDFRCEGTMVRHTLRSWTEAPCDLQQPHDIDASKSHPASVVLREFLIEDLLPCSRDVYWVTAWRKCASCQARDKEFQNWVERKTRSGEIS